MKRLKMVVLSAVLLATLFAGFTSCKKNRTCLCQRYYVGTVVDSTFHTIKNATKDDATTACDKYDQTKMDVGGKIECSLQKD